MLYCFVVVFIPHTRKVHVYITVSSVGIHYYYRTVKLSLVVRVLSLRCIETMQTMHLGVSVPSKKIEAAVAQRDEAWREEREDTGGSLGAK